MEEFGICRWTRKENAPEGASVITTKMFHNKSEGFVRSKIVVRQFAMDKNPDRHVGTPPTWVLKLIISRTASSRSATQIAVHDISVAFCHAELKVPAHAWPLAALKCEGWCWEVV